jgi:eukaryotic translation initiation factor 2C
MFIGADVTHPPGFQYKDNVPPSIAVTVATTNGVNNLYSATIRLQEGRTEPIADIMAMVKGHLEEFKKNTGKLPTNLIFYRDGVSYVYSLQRQGPLPETYVFAGLQ